MTLATFVRKSLTKNFQKLPNLVTLYGIIEHRQIVRKHVGVM